MEDINLIKKPIAEEMMIFEDRFRRSMVSNVALLNKITHYIVKRKGKQMRPMFVFLSAKVFSNVNDNTYIGASLIELLHTATLVHDDVVDDANKRRGFFSINALWKNKIAVLVGDFLLSKGLILSMESKNYNLLDIVTKAVKEMSEGELLQIEKTRSLNLKEDVYFDIIRQKTASLVAACCACGVASVGQDQEAIESMHKFGEYTGLAFQIKDDLFDFGLGEDIGKPRGIDLKEKKLTLPIIYALNQSSEAEKKRVIKIIKKKKHSKKKVEEVLNFVIKYNGLKYAHDKMIELKDKALEVLKKFPENEARVGLETLLNYTINRTK
ncbi:MAG: polyprenyl synthetase family protein [Flavobacteriales bacterium]|nr:polyprenyl synthetase family protein [Flavobacteriales bacterium]